MASLANNDFKFYYMNYVNPTKRLFWRNQIKEGKIKSAYFNNSSGQNLFTRPKLGHHWVFICLHTTRCLPITRQYINYNLETLSLLLSMILNQRVLTRWRLRVLEIAYDLNIYSCFLENQTSIGNTGDVGYLMDANRSILTINFITVTS